MDILTRDANNFFEGGDFTQIVNNEFPTLPILKRNDRRNNLLLTAGLSNTGKIYLGFTNRVSDTLYFFALEAGDFVSIDNYKGEIFAIASTSSQTLAGGEW